ncbi:hypothetical protein GCM10028832_14840 [Streptomyces sparsus]
MVASVSALRFHERDGTETSLNAAGPEAGEVPDVPDRPALERVPVTGDP